VTLKLFSITSSVSQSLEAATQEDTGASAKKNDAMSAFFAASAARTETGIKKASAAAIIPSERTSKPQKADRWRKLI
jgi:hypothetical protein